VVVANAGIGGLEPLEMPVVHSHKDELTKPNLKLLDINLTGVIYTTHLALYHLPRNPGSVPASTKATPGEGKYVRDRHLLLIGSVASLGPVPTQPLYGTAKHGVLGLWRCLRGTAFMHGIRVNLVCPYFVETGILNAGARAFLAGCGRGTVEDVVEGATRLAADQRVLGRSIVVGPRAKMEFDNEKGDFRFYGLGSEPGDGMAVYEAYADDWETSEAFVYRMTKVLNAVQAARGFGGWMSDVVRAVGTLILG